MQNVAATGNLRVRFVQGVSDASVEDYVARKHEADLRFEYTLVW